MKNVRELLFFTFYCLVPFAPSHAAHTDISFKYRLLAIIEQKSPCLPHRPGLERLALPPCQDSFNQKAQINVVLWGSVNCKLLLIPTNEICSR